MPRQGRVQTGAQGQAGAQVPPAQGQAGAQVPPAQGQAGGQMPPAQGQAGAQVPPTQGQAGAQVPPAQGQAGAQVPAQGQEAAQDPAAAQGPAAQVPAGAQQAGAQCLAVEEGPFVFDADQVMGADEGNARRDPRWDEREARLLQRLRAGIAARAGHQGPSEVSVGRALFSIKAFVEKDFDVWLESVSAAFWGAGLFPLFRISAFPRDVMATRADLDMCAAIPEAFKGLAWTALKASIGPDTAAYAALMSVEPGDVLGLLRTMRSNFERKSTPYRHQLLSKLARTNLADYPGIRQYVAALDTFFNKLAKLNHVVLDRDKLFHLQQGLTEEFKRGILGSILATSPHIQVRQRITQRLFSCCRYGRTRMRVSSNPLGTRLCWWKQRGACLGDQTGRDQTFPRSFTMSDVFEDRSLCAWRTMPLAACAGPGQPTSAQEDAKGQEDPGGLQQEV